jgi:hypothetical protein
VAKLQEYGNMGKRDFRAIYQRVEADLGAAPTIKISCISDRFSSAKNFVGIVIYRHDNHTAWTNKKGIKKGYRSRAFYVIIKAIDEAGKAGKPHEGLYSQMFEEPIKGLTCCSGFAVLKGSYKFKSALNSQHGSQDKLNKGNMTLKGDGTRNLSHHEEAIVRAALDAWTKQGPNTVISVPQDIHTQLSATAHLCVISDSDSDTSEQDTVQAQSITKGTRASAVLLID